MTSRIATRELSAITIAFAVVMIATARGYGYHRDELYFLVVGAHPAFGYVDQPPLVPLLVHAMDAIGDHSLVWIRIPSALAGAAVVWITGLLAREFGADRTAQALAAASIAVSAILADAAHLAGTTVFDLLGWTVLSFLVARALRGAHRMWPLAGLCAGIALEIKSLVVFLLLALVVGVAVAGPRQVIRSRWLWSGVAVAILLWLPNVLWQATHGWPQLELSSSIARGSSGTSQPRWIFLPYQGVLVSPVLVPVWVAGWWRLYRDEALRTWRSFAIAYVVLAGVLLVVGGKPYYQCGLYPVLLAAGAVPTVSWIRGAHRRTRKALVAGAIVVSGAVSAVLMLPVLPADDLHATPVVAINYDAGEQIGWPQFASSVAQVFTSIPGEERRHSVFVGENYGEGGAVHRFQPQVPSYSTQNSYWYVAAPPADTTTAVVVGYSKVELESWFASVRPAGHIDNGVDVDNDEQGGEIWLCHGPKLSWTDLWDKLRHFG